MLTSSASVPALRFSTLYIDRPSWRSFLFEKVCKSSVWHRSIPSTARANPPRQPAERYAATTSTARSECYLHIRLFAAVVINSQRCCQADRWNPIFRGKVTDCKATIRVQRSETSRFEPWIAGLVLIIAASSTNICILMYSIMSVSPWYWYLFSQLSFGLLPSPP